MNRGLSTLIACAALVLAAGCGSSNSASKTTTVGVIKVHTGLSGGGLKRLATPNYVVPPAGAAVLRGVVPIAYRDITIQPDAIKVKVGTTIEWTNYDSVQHNVTSESGPEHFASGTLREGRSFHITVTKPGVIHYECTIHPTTMNGTIEVVS
jgi:plastocyanin